MSRYGPRIAALARRAERERAALESASVDADDGSDDDATDAHSDGPAAEKATRYLREGAGEAISVYVDGRTGGRRVPFSAAELEALEGAMNDWLECYALCHGVSLEASFTVREAAELLLETRNVHDVGQLLTGVPQRRTGDASHETPSSGSGPS